MVTKNLILLLLVAFTSGNQDYPEYADDDEYNYYDDNALSNEEGYDGDEEIRETELDNLDYKITSTSKHLVVDSGTTIRLPCEFNYLPESVEIMWKRPDAKTNQILVIGNHIQDEEYKDRTNIDRQPTGSFLNIGVAKPGDAGRYTCQLAIPGKQKLEVTHQVSIRVPPTISQHSDSVVESKKGGQVKLTCKGTGNPAPNVTWTKVGGKGKLPDGSMKKRGEELIISNVNRHDAGVYRCTANNGYTQQASKDIELRVLFEPEIEVQEVFVHKKTGQDVEIVCNVHGVPKPKVTWKKDGLAVKETNRLKIKHQHSKHSLTISEVEKVDFGEYSCHATSSSGAIFKTIEISGMAGPAEYISEPAGQEPTSYILEWSVVSYTPVTAFQIETREAGTTAWKQSTAAPIHDGSYHWLGKLFLKDLQHATRYEARVVARNDEGWSKTKEVFNFATQGAEPVQKGVTAGSWLPGPTFMIILPAAILASIYT